MWIYNLGLVLYVWAIALASPWHRKAKLWIDGRKGLFRRMKESIDPRLALSGYMPPPWANSNRAVP